MGYNIMKSLLVVILIASVLTISDKDIIQQVLNGAFEQNKLAKPTTIVICIDNDSAHKIVVFAGTILDKAARGSLSDLISIPNLIKEFGATLDPKVGECLDGNAELEAIGLKYNPKNASSDDIEKKIIAYVTLHYLSVHKWLVDVDDTWHAENYYQVGFKGATYGHNVLGLTDSSDKDIIQQVLNGAFEQNKLAKPTTIVNCIDNDSAHKIVVFIGTVLDKAAKGSLSDLISLPKIIKEFGATLDPKVGECLDGNAEMEAFGLKYNPKNASSDDIEKKIIAYVTLHYLSVHKWLVDVDDTWHAKNYYQVGFKAATYGHNIMGLSEEQALAEEFATPHLHHEHKMFQRKHSHIAVLMRELKHLRNELHI